MRYSISVKTLNIVSEYLLNIGFLKKKKLVFENEYVIIIFYYCQYHFKIRMYVLDSLTKRHLHTTLYDFKGFRFCAERIKNDIKKLLTTYEKL